MYRMVRGLLIYVTVTLLVFSERSFGQHVSSTNKIIHKTQIDTMLLDGVMNQHLKNSRIGYNPPEPQIGWDSLQRRIVYPELARRAGLEGVVWVVVHFDTSGGIDTIMTHSERGEFFVKPVRDALRSTEWIPPRWVTDSGERVQSGSFSIPILFFVKGNASGHRIMIETERPLVEVME